MSPDMIRNCCGGLFYGKSVAEVKKETLMIKGATDDFLNSVYYVKKDNTFFCHTCRRNILRLNVPKLALSNGLDFPEIDTCLQVTCRNVHPLCFPNQIE